MHCFPYHDHFYNQDHYIHNIYNNLYYFNIQFYYFYNQHFNYVYDKQHDHFHHKHVYSILQLRHLRKSNNRV